MNGEKNILTLGIESTFDDLSFSILKDSSVLNIKTISASKTMIKQFKGVVPSLIAKQHIENLPIMINFILPYLNDIELISCASKPGLRSSINIGVNVAKGIQQYIKIVLNKEIDLLFVDHLKAHMISIFLNEKIDFNILKNSIYLLISGGNTKIYNIIVEEKNIKLNIILETVDDALGEILDKLAIHMGFFSIKEMVDFSINGKLIDDFRLPNVKFKLKENLSFSGLKTYLKNYKYTNKKDFCFSLQFTLFNMLLKKTNMIMKNLNKKFIIIGGGVTKNLILRNIVKNDLYILIPKNEFCTDNGAMIALMGLIERNYECYL